MSLFNVIKHLLVSNNKSSELLMVWEWIHFYWISSEINSQIIKFFWIKLKVFAKKKKFHSRDILDPIFYWYKLLVLIVFQPKKNNPSFLCKNVSRYTSFPINSRVKTDGIEGWDLEVKLLQLSHWLKYAEQPLIGQDLDQWQRSRR